MDDNTVTQSALLHSDIPGYDLPSLDFVPPPEETQENHMIYTHLEKVLTHMIDKQDAKIFKFHDDYARNQRNVIQYLRYAET